MGYFRPVADRIDIQIEVPRVAAAELRPDSASGESSATVRARGAARQRQQGRCG